MNKMGIWQRLWCVMVTFTLLLTTLEFYTVSGQEVVRPLASSPNSSPQSSITLQMNNEPYKSVTTVAERPGTRLSTQTLTMSLAIGTSRPAATKSPELKSAPKKPEATAQAKPKPKAKAKVTPSTNKGSASKPPLSVPVAAPAPEQIIRTMKVMATGYTAGYESTGKNPNHPEYGITYSGVKVRRDKNSLSTIAADPKVLPLGSILYVPEYGYAVVADTGSAIKGSKIDLYFSTTKQVYKEWGKKSVEVQLIKRGNGKCTEMMLKDLSKAIKTYNSVPQSLLEEII